MARSASGGWAYWRSGGGIVLLLSLIASATAWWLIAWPVAARANVAQHAGHFWWTFVHMLGGTAMLFLGGANLYLAGRRIAFPLHRRIGQAYLGLGFIGAGSAIVIALSSAHKAANAPMLTNTSLSLVMLGGAWLAFAALGLRAARNRRFPSHRQWMIRSYVLVWSFVFCRIAGRVPEVRELGDGEAFIWLSWVLPLIVAEIVLQWPEGAKHTRRAVVPPTS